MDIEKDLQTRLSEIILMSNDERQKTLSVEEIKDLEDFVYKFGYELKKDRYIIELGDYKKYEGKFVSIKYDSCSTIYMKVRSCFPVTIDGIMKLCFQGMAFEYDLGNIYADSNYMTFGTWLDREVEIHKFLYDHVVNELSQDEFEKLFNDAKEKMLSTFDKWKEED